VDYRDEAVSFLINPFAFAVAGGDFESIATVTVSGSRSTVTFSSIPQTYQHLQLRGITPFDIRDGSFVIRFNGDTTSSNYRWHWLYGQGSSALAFTPVAAPPGIEIGYDTNINTNSQIGKAMIADILDYSSTAKNKTLRSLCGVDVNGSGNVEVASGLWAQTSAITSITIQHNGNLSPSGYGTYGLAVGTTLALYGVRA
jgi:hypothetical protein